MLGTGSLGLLATMAEKYKVDADRVYSTGHSNAPKSRELGVNDCLHQSQSRRARRWASTHSSDEPTRNGSMAAAILGD